MMINFNNGVEQFNEFLGSERKTTVLYENVRYMLKYPDPDFSQYLRYIWGVLVKKYYLRVN